MQKKALLFDLDGTLINTYENIDYRLILREVKSVQKTLLIKIFKSRIKSFSQLERKIFEKSETPEEAQELIDRITNLLIDHYRRAHLKKDAIRFLQYAKAHHIKCCLVTNNTSKIVNHILADKDLTPYFDYVITSQEVQEAKPHPQMYLLALHHLQLTTSQCYVLEDSEQGVLAAKAAGINDIIVVTQKEKRKFQDCFCIQDFSDPRLYELFIEPRIIPT